MVVTVEAGLYFNEKLGMPNQFHCLGQSISSNSKNVQYLLKILKRLLVKNHDLQVSNFYRVVNVVTLV